MVVAALLLTYHCPDPGGGRGASPNKKIEQLDRKSRRKLIQNV